ncbi:MAG: tRNA epoxyqueuosine(34) reductase QueG [Flavobacteriales bacterium]|nr:tRNA epoxyqueuosine(34) reductase QueG [Flavobacteriales bacterium]
MNRANVTKKIKDEIARLGFSYCGISKAGFLEEEAPRLERYLENNMHGEMSYMERNFDKRLDPTILVPGAKSVISVMYNYFPSQKRNDNDDVKISSYAFGEDYHKVIKDKLYDVWQFILDEVGEVDGRIFVDSAPVLDKAWANKSGLGWVGKNTNLINPKSGSFFFIAEIIVDLDLDYDANEIKDYCGTCTACIDACPTDAIVEPYIVDGSKCISYYTIELKDQIPIEAKGKMDNWVFGCDVCQDVCPWNRFSTAHNEPLFQPKNNVHNLSNNDWLEMTEEIFKEVFRNSPIKRTKFEGIRRNLKFVLD